MSAGDLEGGRGERPLGVAEDRGPLDEGKAGQSVVLTTLGPAAASPFSTVFSVGSANGRKAQAISVLLTPPSREGGPVEALDDATVDVDVEARVTFGVHGVASEARLDVGQGCRISVVASFLRVDVRIATTGPAVVAGTRIRVGAVAGYAAAGSTQGQRTLVATGVGAGGVTAFPIPAYSKAVTVLVAPVSAAGGYSLQWLSAAGTVVGTMDYPTGAAAFGTGPGPEQPNTSSQNGPRAGLPIPTRARSLQFTNGAAAAVRTFVQAIFEVQL